MLVNWTNIMNENMWCAFCHWWSKNRLVRIRFTINCEDTESRCIFFIGFTINSFCILEAFYLLPHSNPSSRFRLEFFISCRRHTYWLIVVKPTMMVKWVLGYSSLNILKWSQFGTYLFHYVRKTESTWIFRKLLTIYSYNVRLYLQFHLFDYMILF